MRERRAPKLRLFVALCPPDDVRRELTAMRRELEKARATGIHWVPPENVHLTLKFLGWVAGDGVPPIEACLAEAAAECSPLVLEVHGAGGFPNPRRARVLWAGLGGSDVPRLGTFAADLERRLTALGFPREDRSFHPHLTLGRARDRAGISGLDAALADLGSREPIAWHATEACLMRSHLSSSGAQYEVIQRATLGRL